VINTPGKPLVITTDTIAENVDFSLDSASARQIGRKTVAISLSDVAAMGGKPLFVVVSAVLTSGLPERFARDLYRGIAAAAKRWQCPLVGGDLTTWGGRIVATSTVGGVAAGRKPVTRAGARPGHRLFVTGTLGGSLARKHLSFTPRLAEGAWLARDCTPSAMIDISDGLGVDAAHIASESNAALKIEATSLPVSRAARRLAANGGKTPIERAVSDGEDFELLFSLSPAKARKCLESWPFRTRLTRIGTVERGSGVRLIHPDGRSERIDTRGYEHVG
jgi:thiamine-monophosphate kinase